MPRISKVTDKSIGIDYGFMFDIRDASEVHDWFEAIRIPRSKEEISDAIRCLSTGVDSSHAKDGGTLLFLAHQRRTSLVDTLAGLNWQIVHGMLDALRRTGRIFINRRGGYFCMRKGITTTLTQDIENWILPDSKVRIIRWPGGKHYYAKIGDLDISEGDCDKWPTEQAAVDAAKRWLRSYERDSLLRISKSQK